MNQFFVFKILLLIVLFTASFTQLFGSSGIDTRSLSSIISELPQSLQKNENENVDKKSGFDISDNRTANKELDTHRGVIISKIFLNQNIILLALNLIIFIILTFIVVKYLLRTWKNKIIHTIDANYFHDKNEVVIMTPGLGNMETNEFSRKVSDAYNSIGIILSSVKMQFNNFGNIKLGNGILPGNFLIDHSELLKTNNILSDIKSPVFLTKNGMFEALEKLFDEVNSSENINAIINIEEKIQRPTENTEILLYRIIQELIENTLKHARATNISLIISKFNNAIRIQYSDNGIGFDTEEIFKNKRQLKNITSRISYLNGEVEIDSVPGKGTMFFINIPLKVFIK